MIRFSYKVLREPDTGWPEGSLEAELNRLGAEGFELRHVLRESLLLVRMDGDGQLADQEPPPGTRPFFAAPEAARETVDALCGCGCGTIVTVPAAQLDAALARMPEAEAFAAGHYEGTTSTCIAVPTRKRGK